MSWSVPTGAVEQIDGQEGTNESGGTTKSFVWKAPYSNLKTASDALVQGDEISSGWIASNWTLRKIPGEWGRLEIICNKDDTGGTSLEPTQETLKEIWSVKSVRNDVSILAYIDGVENPHGRYQVEMWQKETDNSLVEQFKFKDGNGEVKSVEAQLIPLCEKIGSGIESVMRFYPLLTRKTITSNPPDNVLDHLSEVIDPASGFTMVTRLDEHGNAVKDDDGNDVMDPVSSAKVFKAPKNLHAIIAAHEWLKCQDDCEEQADNTWARTESWMGILKSSVNSQHPWDKNLYGSGNDRWKMPHFGT